MVTIVRLMMQRMKKNESDSSNLNEEQAEGKEKLQEIKNEDVECKDDSEEPLDEEEQS